jgi:hypothetical protein
MVFLYSKWVFLHIKMVFLHMKWVFLYIKWDVDREKRLEVPVGAGFDAKNGFLRCFYI